jgi:hypothetical protein
MGQEDNIAHDIGSSHPDRELHSLKKFECGGKTQSDSLSQLQDAFWEHFWELSAEVGVTCEEHYALAQQPM